MQFIINVLLTLAWFFFKFSQIFRWPLTLLIMALMPLTASQLLGMVAIGVVGIFALPEYWGILMVPHTFVAFMILCAPTVDSLIPKRW